jgi:hypothetical protein
MRKRRIVFVDLICFFVLFVRLYSIYGVDVDTEVMYFYKWSDSLNRYKLDQHVKTKLSNYKLVKGIAYETAETPQAILKHFTGIAQTRSGDGTVAHLSFFSSFLSFPLTN